jgi:threonine/homoserine/homoserine lactone efflux protein
MTVIGSTLGNAVLLACIALGLNWILKTSSDVFEILRWVGAAYLVWLGVQTWRHAGQNVEPAPPRGHVYVSRGFLVAITNPKTIAFFTALLPQFIDPSLPAGYQLAVMCIVSVVMAAVTDAGWAIGAGAGRALFLKQASTRWLGRLSGIVQIGGGVWLSLARRSG